MSRETDSLRLVPTSAVWRLGKGFLVARARCNMSARPVHDKTIAAELGPKRQLSLATMACRDRDLQLVVIDSSNRRLLSGCQLISTAAWQFRTSPQLSYPFKKNATAHGYCALLCGS